MATLITYTLYFWLVYLIIGVIFSIWFVSMGLQKVDEDGKGTSFRFKAMILPGAVALWPLLLKKWLQAKRT